MSKIKIGTLNTQNSVINRNGGISPNGIDNAKILADHIKDEDYYFLGTQEMTRSFSSNLQKYLENYKLCGNYRYGNSKLVRSIKLIDSFNENNAIVTNENVNSSFTNLLPFIPNNPKDLMTSIKEASIMSRIVTMAEIANGEDDSIYALNTHLDYRLESVQTKQLKYLRNLIKRLTNKHPVVLMGDFNMEVSVDANFDKFIDELNILGLSRIEVNDKTNDDKFANKTAIDHIFVPSEWQVEECGIIDDKNLDLVTDHKGVYATVKTKKRIK